MEKKKRNNLPSEMRVKFVRRSNLNSFCISKLKQLSRGSLTFRESRARSREALYPRTQVSASYRWLSSEIFVWRTLIVENDSAMFVVSSIRRSMSTLIFVLFVVLGCFVSLSNQCDKNSDCKNGYCRAGMCICNPGWWGNLCQFCRLR